METTYLSKNLSYLRKQKGIIQAEIQAQLGIVKNTWSNWERGVSQPSIENLLVISKFFGVDIGDLIGKDLSDGNLIPELGNKKFPKKGNLKGNPMGNLNAGFAPKSASGGAGSTEEIYYHQPQPVNVFDFESKAAAGAGLRLVEKDKNRIQPNLYLPNLGPGIHVRVPIGGDSMHNTIKDGDRVVATQIFSPSEIRQGHIYLILDIDEDLYCKRVYVDSDTTLELVSDNEIYKPFKRHLKDVYSLFRVREVHTTDLRPYFMDLRREMREIHTEIAAIKAKLK